MATASDSHGESEGNGLKASQYDQWFESPWGRFAFSVERRAVLKAVGPLFDQMRVLDVGSGTGRFTTELEARGAIVVGLDRDQAMLDIATTRTKGRVVLGDAHRIPFPDDAFDCVVAITLCEFTAHPDEVFAELARVTRPGGRMVIGALNPKSPWGLRWKRQLRRPPWSDARFLSRSTLLALAQKYGHVSISGALYAPGAFFGLRLIGSVLEWLGRLTPSLGAFQVVTIERAAPSS